MGIFFEQIEYVNRDCIERSITFDGQRVRVLPNYDANGNFLPDVHNFAPKICAPYALNQNAVMGSEDPQDPSGFESYVVPKIRKKVRPDYKGEAPWRYDFSFLRSKSNKHKTRVDLQDYLNDDSLKVVDGRGPHKMSEAAIAAGATGIATQSINFDE